MRDAVFSGLQGCFMTHWVSASIPAIEFEVFHIPVLQKEKQRRSGWGVIKKPMLHFQLQKTVFQISEKSRGDLIVCLQGKIHVRNLLLSFSSKYSHKNITLWNFLQADILHGVFGLQKKQTNKKPKMRVKLINPNELEPTYYSTLVTMTTHNRIWSSFLRRNVDRANRGPSTFTQCFQLGEIILQKETHSGVIKFASNFESIL